MSLSFASGSLALRERVGTPSVRVITYHRFGNASQDPFSVSPAMFAEQIAWLAHEDRAISLGDLGGILNGEVAPRPGAVLVTIDDGHLSTLTHAAPTLAEYGVPAVAFVTSSLVGADPIANAQPEPYLDWQQLSEVEAAGITIGSHSHTHRSLAMMSIDEALEDTQRSREILTERLAGPIDSFAYPYGTRADYDAETGHALVESGYTFGFTSRHGTISSDALAIELPRVKVEGGETLRMFKWLCRGGMDAWRLVDDVLFRTQQRRDEQIV